MSITTAQAMGEGRIDFDSLTDFIDGNVDRWRFLYGDPTRKVSQKSFGFFAQDDFRIRSNVTLNLGLRYDITDPIKDSHNLLANYVPVLNGQPGGIIQVGQGISDPYPTNYNNLSPRVGVAWDVFGNGKTVFRSAFGIIFEQPSIRTFMFNGGGLNLNPSGIPFVDENGVLQQPKGTITSFLQESGDGSQITWNSAGPVFPAAAGAQCSIDNQCSLFAVNQNLRTPYVMNWNFNIQQQLTNSTLLQIGYVANHGVKLYSGTDINQVDPNSPLENDPNNPDFCDHCEEYGRPLVDQLPDLSLWRTRYWWPVFSVSGISQLSEQSVELAIQFAAGHSDQALFARTLSAGGYTWAHAIDTATSNLAGVPPSS